MSLFADPVQLYRNDGDWEGLAPRRRLWGSRPASLLLGKEKVQGYSTQLDSPVEPTRASLSLTPIQQEICFATTEIQWLSFTLVLPSQTAPSLDRIQLTWQALAAHNPILRSTLVNLGSSADQIRVVVDAHVPPLRFSTVSGYAPGSRSETIPPYAIFRIRETGEPTITLQIPRVLVDETSLRLIQRDFSAFYRGKAFSEHAPFSAYVQDILSRDVSIARAFWKGVLETSHQHAPLFQSSPQTALPSNNRTRLSVSSDLELLERLAGFERRTGFERYTALQAAWALVLAQHQSTDNVLFGITTRDSLPDTYKGKTAVGRMDVRFPLSVHVGQDTPIPTLLSLIQRAGEEGRHHAFIGFKNILEQAPFPSLTVQSCLKFVGGTGDSSFCVDDDDFALTLRVAITNQIRLTIQYNAGIPETKIRVLLDHCLAALEHVLTADSGTTSTLDGPLDLIGAAEKAFILDKALPVTESPGEGLLHTLFEKQAMQSPDRIAVQFEASASMTYKELNQAANQVAQQLPCGPGSIVPIYMDRSVELIVAILAVLKSGAAYVILDPDSPMERCNFIIEDVRAPFVLTRTSRASRLQHPTMILDRFLFNSAVVHSENLNIEQSSSHAAYVIYTSGSTGTPKGVLLEHGAAVNGLLSAPRIDGLRSLLFYNPVFSAAQRTIFTALTQGGCLCLASKESLTVSLSETINAMNINTIGLTSSTASLLNPDAVPSLQRMTVTGEKVSTAVVSIWAGKVELHAAYGLSECTQLNWRVKLEPESNPREVGRPRDTTSAYVLIPGTTRLAPLLVPGELCLGGHQLARSYLNRPEQTARSFIQNPFHPGRLYRTGDMAVCLENGNIELLGRIDFKVKIAGQQVNPVEVAVVLQDSGYVKGACVVPVILGEETCLVACLVLDFGTSWDDDLVKKLRSHAQSKLPSYSVPSFWLPFDELPQNANGKIDIPGLRKHIEQMGREGLVMHSRSKGPSGSAVSAEKLTPTEQIVRQVWAEVLQLEMECIGADDGFLTLGGSSLHAIMIATKMHEHGLGVSAANIIQSSSLRDLASTLVNSSVTPDVIPERLSLLRASTSFKADDLARFDDAYPSSALQEALVASSMAGGSDYLYQRVWNIEGIDQDRLHSAFQKVFETTDILRTSFLEDGASFLQVVLKPDYPLHWEEHFESLEEFKTLDMARGIILGQPFFRVAVLPAQSLLVVTTHHSLFDYWCNNFVYEDVAAVYHGGDPSYRPQFKYFIRNLVDASTANAHAFWSEYLNSATPSRIGHGMGSKHTITRTVRGELQPFLKSHSLTLGSLVYAAWALVLSSRTSSDDVVFATTLSGRDAPIRRIESMNGPTLTSVPQRIRVDSKVAVLDYLRAVQEGLWALNMHAQYGMRNALRSSGNEPSIFDTLVNVLVKAPSSSISKTGEVFRPHGMNPAWSTEYTMLEAVAEDDQTMVFRLSSDFDIEQAGFILDQLTNAFEAIMERPNDAITSISFIGEAELTHLQSLSPHIETGAGKLLHSRFEQVVAATPHRIALQWQSSEYISYTQLNNRANRLASILRAAGVGPNVFVPICLDKSVDMIVSVLAVLKAGGAYVPLDPGNPPQRNTFITADVEAKVILCGREYAHIFTSAGLEAILVEDLHLSGHWPNIPVASLTPDHLAYTIYTSGSTGTPKGVLISHSAVSTAIESIIDLEECAQDWRTLLFSNYVFDVSVSDIFTILGTGATLCLAPTPELLSDLALCINSMGVTQIFLTPTVAKLITPDDVPGISKIILGGEPLTPDLVAKWTPKCTVINGYGPTEASIFAAMAIIPPGGNPRVIGKPLKTVSAVILQVDGLDLVPFGAVGELCLSGPQIARGYLKRDDVTAKSFVEWRGKQIYRTGDLVRWLPDGQLECFGRKDQQIKLHGHRIELGEIEQAILRTKQVSDCLVAVVDIQGKAQLVAFCIFDQSLADVVNILPAEPYTSHVESLSSGLTTLPPYMIPRVWIPISSFPLLPSGKADRKQIIRLIQEMDAVTLTEYSSGGGSVEMVVPETAEEKLLQEAWADLLQVEPQSISALSSFFSMGGDSITAINLLSKCRRAKYSLSVGDVLAFPVLRDMAKNLKPIRDTSNTISRRQADYDVSPAVYGQLAAAGVDRNSIESIIPAVPGQAEFLTQGHSDGQFWQLLTVRQLPTDLDFEKWVDLTRRLTQLNAILRTMYLRDNQTWLQVTLRDPVLDLETVEVADDAAKDRAIQEAWEQPFEISKPFVRYRLIVLPDHSRFLAIKLDHAMYDGTLLRIFDSQFVAMAHQQAVDDPVPFQRFSDYIHGLDKSEPLAFWTELLKDNSFVYPAVTEQPRVNATMLRKMDGRVDSFAQQCGATVSTIFQAAFSLLLGSLSNSCDVSYDNLVTGRNVELEDAQLINGTCANFIPFRSSLPPSSTVQNLLKDTQSLFWKTTENATVGLSDIYSALDVDRHVHGNKCLFLFQPFEPASGPIDHMRWLVMSLSKVTMPVNYALMLEVMKAAHGYTLRMKYDSRVYSTQAAEEIGDKLVEIVNGILENPNARLETVLGS